MNRPIYHTNISNNNRSLHIWFIIISIRFEISIVHILTYFNIRTKWTKTRWTKKERKLEDGKKQGGKKEKRESVRSNGPIKWGVVREALGVLGAISLLMAVVRDGGGLGGGCKAVNGKNGQSVQSYKLKSGSIITHFSCYLY